MSKTIGHRFQINRLNGLPPLEGYLRSIDPVFTVIYNDADEIVFVNTSTIETLLRVGDPKAYAATEAEKNPEDD